MGRCSGGCTRHNVCGETKYRDCRISRLSAWRKSIVRSCIASRTLVRGRVGHLLLIRWTKSPFHNMWPPWWPIPSFYPLFCRWLPWGICEPHVKHLEFIKEQWPTTNIEHEQKNLRKAIYYTTLNYTKFQSFFQLGSKTMHIRLFVIPGYDPEFFIKKLFANLQVATLQKIHVQTKLLL